jgi:hypothetical protein
VSGFFVPLLVERGLVELPVEEVHHAVRTLRCRVGEEAYLSNGQGLLARARFVEIKGERAVLEVLEVWERPGEPPAPMGLVVAFLKAPDRIGWLVEKAVELGATDIFLVPFARSFPRRPSESRLRRIAIAALKQNLRSVLPRIQVCSQWEEVPWMQRLSAGSLGRLGRRCLSAGPSLHSCKHALDRRPRRRLYVRREGGSSPLRPYRRKPGTPALASRNRRPPLPKHPQNPLGILTLCRMFASWQSSLMPTPKF